MWIESSFEKCEEIAFIALSRMGPDQLSFKNGSLSTVTLCWTLYIAEIQIFQLIAVPDLFAATCFLRSPCTSPLRKRQSSYTLLTRLGVGKVDNWWFYIFCTTRLHDQSTMDVPGTFMKAKFWHRFGSKTLSSFPDFQFLEKYVKVFQHAGFRTQHFYKSKAHVFRSKRLHIEIKCVWNLQVLHHCRMSFHVSFPTDVGIPENLNQFAVAQLYSESLLQLYLWNYSLKEAHSNAST